ncbi:MAG: zinc-ribbon domain-containing protein [Deltaproteobacteria bacterium]|nr:zinc-ribbon domain-containing protein [Candidatus Zymogenaceae bacterium]
MKVTCPHCGISGSVDEERLRASSGRLRCPGCRENFTVPLSQTGAGPAAGVYAEEDVIVTDDIHAAHADAIEAAMNQSIYDVMLDDSPDEIDELLADPDVKDFLDLPTDLGHIDEALDEFGVPERPRDEESAAGTSDEFDETTHGGEPVLDGAPDDMETAPDALDEDEPLILEEVVEYDGGETDAHVIKPRRKLFPISSLSAAVRNLPRLSPPRAVLSSVLLVLILATAGILVVTRFYLPFKAEKAFIEDSFAMFEEYRRLQIFLDVGVSDSYYIASVAEGAYLLTLYREEYGTERTHHPLYAAVTATGDLFLATVSFIDRMLQPDIYAGSEWGTDLPYASRETYTTSLLEEMSRCFFQIDENMAFLHKYRDTLDRVTFVSFFLDQRTLLDHSTEAARLASIHEDFISTPSVFPFFTEIIDTIEKDLAGLR